MAIRRERRRTINKGQHRIGIAGREALQKNLQFLIQDGGQSLVLLRPGHSLAAHH
jgi:hypothetical protein